MKSATPKTITITQRDFDKAVQLPWNTDTCVLAQTALRLHMIDGSFPDVERIRKSSRAANDLMVGFDNAHHWKPNKKQIAKLRAMLPIKVRLF